MNYPIENARHNNIDKAIAKTVITYGNDNYYHITGYNAQGYGIVSAIATTREKAESIAKSF